MASSSGAISGCPATYSTQIGASSGKPAQECLKNSISAKSSGRDDDELAEFSVQLLALVRRWADRETPEDGRDRGPVFVFAHGIPARP